jgi:type I restriction enzyme S subunit
VTPQRLADVLETLADGPPWDTGWLRSVLPELAVLGCLAPQDPSDPPFPNWDDQVKSAAIVIKEVASSTPKRTDHDRIDASPLPLGWRWSVMGDVGLIVGGGTPDSGDASFWADAGTAVPWVTPADLDDPGPKFVTGGRRDISAAGLEGSSARVLPAGSVLFSSRAPIGKVAVAGQPLATNQGFKSCIPFVPTAAGFVYLWLLVARTSIAANATGTTFKEISGRDFARVPIALPPLPEQHRIVAKVDELMGHAKVLEERHLAPTSTRVRLRDAALHALAEAEDHAAAEIAWARIEEHFEDLFTEPEDIKSLRQTILQLAVRGRLVKQEAGEWMSCTFGEQITLQRGFDITKSQQSPGDVPVVSSGGVKTYHNVAIATGPGVVIGRKGSVGRVHWLECDYWPHDTTLWVKDFHGNLERYVYLFLLNFPIREHESSTANPSLNRNRLHPLPVDFPPLAEQHRIVAKVDELMALCDTLEASLTRAKACREQFAGSISAALGVDPTESPDRNAA